MLCDIAVEGDGVAAKADGVSMPQYGGAMDASSVDEGAVATSFIVENVATVVMANFGMEA